MWPSLCRINIEEMEQEMVKKKRGREGEEVKDCSNKSTKTLQADDLSHPQSVSNNTINIEGRSCKHEEDNNISNNSYEITGDNCFAFGVFDFPWLKEEGSSSMISKAEEEWCLEDTIFSSSLHYSTEFSGQCLWETTPDALCIESCVDVPVDKFEEINVWSLEMESTIDCTWSSLLQNKGD
ncbi:unnamed protein product [Dovyalis caffra]|uniref:Uncharacterized protein n=1 Tax=Dovyalis caffra TaxID=77055 RepID=A0AAV1QNT8_9ROSI|nr:unnamed protein product [Dovyalis caffra]